MPIRFAVVEDDARVYIRLPDYGDYLLSFFLSKDCMGCTKGHASL